MRFDHEQLRRLRLEKKWSQQETASEIGISTDRYGRYESGKVDFSRLRSLHEIQTANQYETLVNMAAVFDLPGPEALFVSPLSVDRLPPPTSPYAPDFYVHRSAAERDGLNCLHSPGAPLVLQGPQWHGKGTLFSHLMHQVQGSAGGPVRLCRLRLSQLGAAELLSLDLLLRALGRCLLPDDGAEALLSQAFSRPGSSRGNLTWLLKRHVLRSRGWLVLLIEDAECLWSRPAQDDFFDLLRTWAESDADDPLAALRIVVSLSIESARLQNDLHRSPFFTKAQIVRVEELEPPELLALARLHGLELTNQQAAEIRSLLGGHPYLWRQALYRATTGQIPLPVLRAHGRTGFELHLAHLSQWVVEERLAPALTAILGGAAVDQGDACRLYQKGLVLRGEDGHWCVRYSLYAAHFERHLRSLG